MQKESGTDLKVTIKLIEFSKNNKYKTAKKNAVIIIGMQYACTLHVFVYRLMIITLARTTLWRHRVNTNFNLKVNNLFLLPRSRWGFYSIGFYTVMILIKKTRIDPFIPHYQKHYGSANDYFIIYLWCISYFKKLWKW